MAKVNKSQLVRDYVTEHPDAGPSAVAKALRKYKITPNYVSNVKLKMKNAAAKDGLTMAGYAYFNNPEDGSSATSDIVDTDQPTLATIHSPIRDAWQLAGESLRLIRLAGSPERAKLSLKMAAELLEASRKD